MIKELLNELKKSCMSILPIFVLVLFLELIQVIKLSSSENLAFILATIFVVVGVALFNFGAEHAMSPIGVSVGKGLVKKGKYSILLIAGFLFGFFITIAEPDLSVLALQTESIFPKWLLIIAIAVSVGVFLLFAILKVVKKHDLIRLLSILYMIAFALVAILAYQSKEYLVGLCFDSGGVTTGPMTVPFLMAMGVGVASILARKSDKDASFGFIAFSSIGPIIILLVLSIFSKGTMNYTLADYALSDHFFKSFFTYVFEKVKGVGLSVFLLFACFMIVNLLFLKIPKKKIKQLLIGLVFVFVGLVIFLAAVDSTYMGIGYKIGTELSTSSNIVIIIVAFVIGALTVLAEPAIKILINQVEDITNGLVKKKSLLIALSIGVGLSLCLGLLRIIYKFSLLYIIIPGYLICFILTFFIPKIYTAIAFDAGGVASGPLTSSFILPIALGLCTSLNGIDSILSYGFGIVALVALSPLLAIEILGVLSNLIHKKKLKKEYKKVLKEDDKVLITFGE